MDDRSEAASRQQTANRRGLLSNLTSGLALGVSIFALAIGAWQTRLMQGQAHASVWPFVALGYTYNSNTDMNGFVWHVDNNGVGPAKVETVTLSVDGKPMKRWADVLAELGVNHRSLNMSTSSLNGDVIPPNINRETTIEAVRINEREVAALFKGAIARFKMDVCYCSVYDECWIAHWQQTKVDAVEKCSTDGLVLFEE